MIVKICCWLELVALAVYVLYAPFTIGKPREPRTAVDYVWGIVWGGVPGVIVVGRVMGWW